MRYSKNEHVVVVGVLPANSVVKIKIINVANDALLSLTDDNCVESTHIEGVYLWSTVNIANSEDITTYTNLVAQMYVVGGDAKHYAKFVIGGYVDDDIVVDLAGSGFDSTEILDILNIINARM